MVRPRDVARYAAEALDVLSSRTVQLHLNVLHNVYATAMRDELVEANPVTGAERPKAKTAAVADPRAASTSVGRAAGVHERARADDVPDAGADQAAAERTARPPLARRRSRSSVTHGGGRGTAGCVEHLERRRTGARRRRDTDRADGACGTTGAWRRRTSTCSWPDLCSAPRLRRSRSGCSATAVESSTDLTCPQRRHRIGNG